VPTGKKADPASVPTDPAFARLFELVREEGFPLVGAVDLDLAAAEFSTHSARYAEWISNGHHGEMGYLERGLERRLDPRKVFPAARSVMAVAIPYRREAPPTEGPRYARYLRGPDYHKRMPEMLERALGKWEDETRGPRPTWKVCVDTSAVLERSWAALCGLGWIGKNTLLIHPQLGSYLFLGVVLLDRACGAGPSLLPSYCGQCTRCLDGCPTGAILRPGTVDSRKCISYLTLEKRGEWAIEPETRKRMGSWIAGCDVCQEVCPFNTKPTKLPETWPLDPRDAALLPDWESIEAENEEAYRARVKTSSLSRIKHPEMRRNVANARANATNDQRVPDLALRRASPPEE
jgi:epoxyqueuosine reductase